MKTLIGRKFYDSFGNKSYLYTLVSCPSGSSFNLLGENGRLLFFYFVSEERMDEYLKNLKPISIH